MKHYNIDETVFVKCKVKAVKKNTSGLIPRPEYVLSVCDGSGDTICVWGSAVYKDHCEGERKEDDDEKREGL